MIDVSFAAPLRCITHCSTTIVEDADTVGALLASLETRYPGLTETLLDNRGVLRPHLNLYLNKTSIKTVDGLGTKLVPGDAVYLAVTTSGG